MKKLDFKVFKFKDKINFIIPKNDQRSRIAGSIYSKYYYYLVVTECLLCNNGDYVKFVIGVYKNDINIIIVDVDESWKTVYIDKIKEMSAREVVIYAKEELNANQVKEFRRRWLDAMMEHYQNDIQQVKGVKEFLDKCKSEGIRMGIATGTNETLSVPALQKQGLL